MVVLSSSHISAELRSGLSGISLMAIAVFCLQRVVPPAFWASLRSRVDPGEWKKQNRSSSRAYALQGSPSLFRYAHFGWLCTSGLHLHYLVIPGWLVTCAVRRGIEIPE